MVNKWKKGSMTVEAACLMSLILFLLMGVLYLFFWVHNRAWLTAAAYEAAVSGSMEGSKAEGNARQEAERKGRELGSMGFFGAENLTVQTAGEKKIQVTYDLDTISGFGGFSWHLKAEGKASVVKPVTWIRKVKAAAEMIEGLGDGG